MKIATILLVLIAVSSVYTADVCEETLTQHNCEFYSNCLEKKFECGAKGYPIGYGFKYCSKFLANQKSFPPKGQEWIDSTLLCLKQALIPFTTKNKDSNTCTNILNAAFDSHPECYVKAGFCQLFFRADVGDTIKALLATYEVNDFKSLISIKQIFETAKLCGADFLKKIWDIINGKGFLETSFENFLAESKDILN